MYAVIIFDTYTSAVPLTWVNIEKKTVFWPPKNSNLSTLIKKKVSPTVNWLILSYKKIVYKCESYEEARKVEKETMYLSSDESYTTTPQNKRKIIKKQFSDYETNMLSAPPSDFLDEESQSLLQFNPQPGPSTSYTNTSEDNKTDNLVQQILNSEIIYESNLPTSNEELLLSYSNDNNTDEDVNKSYCQEDDDPKPEDKNISYTQEYNTEDFEQPNKKKKSFAEPIHCPCHVAIRKVLSDLHDIKEELKTMKQHSEKKPVCQDFSLLPPFPTKNEIEFNEFEKNLSRNNDMQIQFKNKLRLLGGRDWKHNIRKIMEFIMDTDTATKFTWTGAKSPNMAIRGTTIMKIMTALIREDYDQIIVKDNDIEKTVREWLRHASDRKKK